MLKKSVIVIFLLLLTNPAFPDVPVSNSTVDTEIDCLAQTTYHESRGEPYTGKIAVAQVAMNRVKSGKFPNSICRVVNQRINGSCQFSWACHKRNLVRTSEAFIREKKLATAVYYGMMDDVAKGATHFHNRSIRPKWASKLTLTTRIGNHFFYKSTHING